MTSHGFWLRRCCLLLLTSVGGCGSTDGSAPLRGKVLLRGQPIQVSGLENGFGWVKLQLLPVTATMNEPQKIVEAGVTAAGDFHIQTHNGNGQAGLLPGKYRIGIEVEDNGRRLHPEYELKRSKLVRELPPPEGDLTLDFAAP